MKNLRQQATPFSRVFWRALVDTGKDWPACRIRRVSGRAGPLRDSDDMAQFNDRYYQSFPMLTASFIEPCYCPPPCGLFCGLWRA